MMHRKPALTFKDKPVADQIRLAGNLARGAGQLKSRLDGAPVSNSPDYPELLAQSVEEAAAAEVKVAALRQQLRRQIVLRNQLVKHMQYRARIVQHAAACRHPSPAELLAMGLKLKRKWRRIGIKPAPRGRTAKPGKAGSVLVTWSPTRCRQPQYLIQISEQPEAGWRPLKNTLRCRHEFEGLEPGKLYWFRVATFGSAGRGPWSEPFSGRAG